MSLVFDRSFDPAYGRAVPVGPNVARLTANNPGPYTFAGTNTYLIGTGRLAVIDPGPLDAAHFDALKRAIASRPVAHILLTHHHADHAALVPRLAAETGAPVLAASLTLPIETSEPAAAEIRVDHALADGETLEGDGYALEAVATPGHASDHLCFALAGTGLLFSGDHVMAWSTTVVAPPDGSMRDYMASLDKLAARRDDTRYLPGHGGPVERPQAYVASLKAHRLERERAILVSVSEGLSTVAGIVDRLYEGLDPALRPAAGLSVLAHLEDMADRGLVEVTAGPPLAAAYVAVSPRVHPPGAR